MAWFCLQLSTCATCAVVLWKLPTPYSVSLGGNCAIGVGPFDTLNSLYISTTRKTTFKQLFLFIQKKINKQCAHQTNCARNVLKYHDVRCLARRCRLKAYFLGLQGASGLSSSFKDTVKSFFLVQFRNCQNWSFLCSTGFFKLK